MTSKTDEAWRFFGVTGTVSVLLISVAGSTYATAIHTTVTQVPLQSAFYGGLLATLTAMGYGTVLTQRGYGSKARWAYCIAVISGYIAVAVVSGLGEATKYHFNWLDTSIQYAVFALVCVPLVHWWHKPVKVKPPKDAKAEG